MMLPQDFLVHPIAHRALHNRSARCIENSISAVQAAIDHGYGIEIDIQPALDGTPMVFHDYDLARLTDVSGFISQTPLAQLTVLKLIGSDEGIPTLADVLAVVNGQVPLLIEIKDQDGSLGPAVGALERKVCEVLTGYRGQVALMSFNPNSVRACRGFLPNVPRGLTTDAFTKADWPMVPQLRREKLARISEFDHVEACFISHSRKSLTSPNVAALKARGVPVLTWTIRTPEEEVVARKIVDNITFEGYRAAYAT